MNPAVFLANPNSGGLKAFLQVARPGVREWVKNHYENFRMQFAPPARGFPGSHSIQSGFMFRHHVFGEYHTYYMGFPVLRTYDFYGAHPRYYPSMDSDFDTWPWLDSEGGVFLDGEPVEANALQSDLQQGGQSTYFLLPSLGKLVIDNLRLGLATPKELARFMAVTIMTFDKEQGKEERKSPRSRPNVFDTVEIGGQKYYRVFDILHELITSHPQYDMLCTEARLDPSRAFNLTAARNKISQRFEDELDDFKEIEYDVFKKACEIFLGPLLRVLEAPFPVTQIVQVLNTNEVAVNIKGRNAVGWRNLKDNIKNGNWRVTRSGRKDKKPVVDLVSEVDGTHSMKNVPVSVIFIPTGEADLRTSFDIRNSSALPLFEVVMEAFFYFDHLNAMGFSKINHSRFTRDHFKDYDGTDNPGAWSSGKDSKPFGDWFIDARTDHTLAFFGNMWERKPKMRKSLEAMFKGDNFSMAEVQWYTEVISKHLNPVLIPQMMQREIPTRAVMIAPVVPEDQQVQLVGELTDIELKLESPLLRDAYRSYTMAFNEWFSQLLIGANRGFLFAEPFGPKGPGGDAKKAKKKIKAARESMAGSVREAWGLARANVLSLRNLGISNKAILNAIKQEVNRAHINMNTSRPALPLAGANDLDTYLNFISDLYESDPTLLAAVSSAADMLRINNTADISQIEDMFITDIRRHMKMKALGTVKFPALATVMQVLRRYTIIPSDQLNEFVARQLSDDMQALIKTRAEARQGFLTAPDPTIVPPRSPPILRMRGEERRPEEPEETEEIEEVKESREELEAELERLDAERAREAMEGLAELAEGTLELLSNSNLDSELDKGFMEELNSIERVLEDWSRGTYTLNQEEADKLGAELNHLQSRINREVVLKKEADEYAEFLRRGEEEQEIAATAPFLVGGEEE